MSERRTKYLNPPYDWEALTSIWALWHETSSLGERPSQAGTKAEFAITSYLRDTRPGPTTADLQPLLVIRWQESCRLCLSVHEVSSDWRSPQGVAALVTSYLVGALHAVANHRWHVRVPIRIELINFPAGVCPSEVPIAGVGLAIPDGAWTEKAVAAVASFLYGDGFALHTAMRRDAKSIPCGRGAVC